MVFPAPRSHGAPRRALTGAARISAARCVLNVKTRSVPKPLTHGPPRRPVGQLSRRPDLGRGADRAAHPVRARRTRESAHRGAVGALVVHCCQGQTRGRLLLVALVLALILLRVVAALRGLDTGLLQVGELLLDVVLEAGAVVALEGAQLV